VEMRIASKI